jgi:hypothetical protein
MLINPVISSQCEKWNIGQFDVTLQGQRIIVVADVLQYNSRGILFCMC